MNIFAVNPSPYVSAKELPLKLIIKMPTETVQLLCSAFSLERLAQPDVPRKANGEPYRHFNPKHPCSIWVRQSYYNFEWAALHAIHLTMFYNNFYKREHGVQKMLRWICSVDWEVKRAFRALPFCNRTPFVQAMPYKYKNENPFLAYQNYIVGEKQHYAKWNSLENIPSWWPDKTENSVDKSFVDGIYTKR